MKHLPTDHQLLEVIYDCYYDSFAAFSKERRARDSKVYVPIDITSIANKLGVEGDIVFGRLYFHLDQKYGYKRDDGTHVPFFSLKVGGDNHCINFPLLASVLASLRSEHWRFRLATTVSIISLVVSIAALLISLFDKG